MIGQSTGQGSTLGQAAPTGQQENQNNMLMSSMGSTVTSGTTVTEEEDEEETEEEERNDKPGDPESFDYFSQQHRVRYIQICYIWGLFFLT